MQFYTMRIMMIILFTLLGIAGLLYLFQEHIIFFPQKLKADFKYQFATDFIEINYPVAEGVFINALHFKANNSKGVVFYSHGNAGNLSQWGHIAQYFLTHNYDVLIYDYRSYGKSNGKLSEQNMYHDADFIYSELLKSFDEHKIFVYGRSIGTGVATYVASRHNPSQLILESPYYNMPDLVRSIVPVIPGFLLRFKFRIDKMIVKVKCPVLIFHGTEDEVIYYGSSLKLKKHFKSSDRLVTIEGGKHNNLDSFKIFHQELAAILR